MSKPPSLGLIFLLLDHLVDVSSVKSSVSISDCARLSVPAPTVTTQHPKKLRAAVVPDQKDFCHSCFWRILTAVTQRSGPALLDSLHTQRNHLRVMMAVVSVLAIVMQEACRP
ncbi:hypothetical protein BD289DRAFT_217366 [Coniella lustricola]|uniref:Secreted protein n=1 Tax=Coniella lustricola TaxID=2025994 RepID=A0A2T3ABD4_9PEZI|nr:hypothetical protein BD289DRAFT_217366 [Coniella lustricola]